LLPSFPAGLPRARNAAVKASAADLIVFVDDDVRLHPGFLLAHAEAANRFPAAAGVAGRVCSPDEWEAKVSQAVGQIRATGTIDVNFNRTASLPTLVPHTAMGTNMSYRRERLASRFGTDWFDASLEGTAIREESTLGLALQRAGEFLVFASEAALDHLEAKSGGCNNRGTRSFRQELDHATLEMLFLARLHQGTGPFHAAASLWSSAKLIRSHPKRLTAAASQLGGYWLARRRYARTG
jgi:GT2 family glycosyltransferase